MKRLALMGLTHRTAPVEVRERLAISRAEAPRVLEECRQALGPGGEAVVISTCNRVELYVAADALRDGCPDLLARLAAIRGLPPELLEATRPHTFLHRGERVIEHLFSVTASLDSMVPGETQILGQVRRAYELARAHGSAGRVLHGLFQRALAVGREVMSTTDLAAGRLSVASVAVGYARQIFDRLDDKTALCIGAGKMARLVVERLRDGRVGRLVVCNRDGEKARRFAEEFGGEGRPLEDLDRLLAEADVVVTSTGSRVPVIRRDNLEPAMRRRRYRPLFIIDIAVPRDVDPAVADINNLYLYDLDDLNEAVRTTLAGRQQALDAARAIVTRNVGAWLAWHRTRDAGGTIEKLYDRSHAVAREELERALRRLGELDPETRRQVEPLLAEMSRRLVNKLLHGPVSALRDLPPEDHHSPAYHHAIEKLFALGDGQDQDHEAPPQ